MVTAHPDNPGQSFHLKIFMVISSAKSVHHVRWYIHQFLGLGHGAYHRDSAWMDNVRIPWIRESLSQLCNSNFIEKCLEGEVWNAGRVGASGIVSLLEGLEGFPEDVLSQQISEGCVDRHWTGPRWWERGRSGGCWHWASLRPLCSRRALLCPRCWAGDLYWESHLLRLSSSSSTGSPLCGLRVPAPLTFSRAFVAPLPLLASPLHPVGDAVRSHHSHLRHKKQTSLPWCLLFHPI